MRRAACVALFAIAAGLVLAGLVTGREVAIVVLLALLWYPIDRLILAAMPDLRPRRHQDTP